MEELNATDLDTGVNAEIRYRIQQGSFDDFQIDSKTGVVIISKKLDFDGRNNYIMEIVASDMGTPSLSGTATLAVNILDSNDKAPYFTPTTQSTEISENAEIGKIIHKMEATDPDIKSKDDLVFSFGDIATAVDQEGNKVLNTDGFKDYFTIDNMGQVTLNKKLRRDLFAVST